MARKQDEQVTAIVPAYNEEDRIGRVLKTLTTYPGFKEVIVVDDASTDRTAEIAKRYPVRYIKNRVNRGKGHSMDGAVKLSTTEVIFFCDADVIGLNHRIIDEITRPVVREETEMMIGMRNRKAYYMRFLLAFVPLFGGERALTKRLWNMLPSYFKHRFRIEAGLNFYAKYYGKGFKYKVFQGLKQTIKEKKYGLADGIKQRIGMYADVLAAQARLEMVDLPKKIRNKRKNIVRLSTELSSAVLGAAIIAAAMYGPVRSILWIFRKELAEDPGAPLAHVLLRIANNTSAAVLFYIGVLIILLNLMFMAMTLTRMVKQKL